MSDYQYAGGVVSSDEFDAFLNEKDNAGRAPVYGKAKYDLGLTWFEKGHNAGAEDVFVPCGVSKESREAALNEAYKIALKKGISLTRLDKNGKEIKKSPTFAIRIRLYKDYSYKNLGGGFSAVTWLNGDQVHTYPKFSDSFKVISDSLKFSFTTDIPFGKDVVVETLFVPDPNDSTRTIETTGQVFASFDAMVEKMGIILNAIPNESILPGYTDEVKSQGYDALTWGDMISQFKAMFASGKTVEQIAGEFSLPVESVSATLS